MLAKILRGRPGFRTTFSFPLDPDADQPRQTRKSRRRRSVGSSDAIVMLLRCRAWPRAMNISRALHRGCRSSALRTSTMRYNRRIVPELQ